MDVARTLGMKNELVVSISPCKNNIKYTLAPHSTDIFKRILERISDERAKFPRMIIYCRRCEDCADLYLYFKTALESNFTEPPGCSRFSYRSSG